MRFSPVRFTSLATLLPTLLLFVLVSGCGKQSEGERCGEELGSASDVCGDGLICTLGTSLINQGNGANRCCYSDGHVTDSRCERSDGSVAPNNGSGGSGASAGSTASGGSSTGGSADNGTAGGSTEMAGASSEGN